MKTYPGGKGGAGVYQFLINQIPPHDLYIDGYLGNSAIMRFKRPARLNIGSDRDPGIIDHWRAQDQYRYKRDDNAGFYFFCESFLDLLARIDQFDYEPTQTFIYLDPPYLPETRKNRKIYDYEMNRADHIRLLSAIRERPEMIMISGYQSSLYAEALDHWRTLNYTNMTRSGPALETVWMNYKQPNKLHDYSFLGSDFTDRQRIKRKIQRLRNKLLALPPLERSAVMDGIDDID